MKPKLVIIGETHPDKIEDMLSFMDLLKRREISTLSGRKRFIPASGHPGTKLRVKHIVTDIIKREGDILKENGITRLMIEIPRSEIYLSAFKDYRKNRDITKVKNRLCLLAQDERKVEYGKAAEFVDGLNVSAKAREFIFDLLKAKAGSGASIMPIFYLAQLNAAKRAGLFDIVPVEDPEAYTKASALRRLLELPDIQRSLDAKAPSSPGMNGDLGLIARSALMQIANYSHEREERMAMNIEEGYTPGSAVLIGKGHLKSIVRLLSGRFEVREYAVNLPDALLSL